MAAYSATVMEHFEHPRNSGEMTDPDGEATTSNPVCGDRMRVMIRVEGGRVFDLYYDRAPKGAGRGKGAWFLWREVTPE